MQPNPLPDMQCTMLVKKLTRRSTRILILSLQKSIVLHLLQWAQWLQALGAQEMQWAQALDKDPDYRCTPCQGTACPLKGRPQREVQVGPDKLEEVASFCYLGDKLSAVDGCEQHVKTPWKKFKELLPVLLPPHFQDIDRIYSSCVRSTILHTSEPCQISNVCSQMIGK